VVVRMPVGRLERSSQICTSNFRLSRRVNQIQLARPCLVAQFIVVKEAPEVSPREISVASSTILTLGPQHNISCAIHSCWWRCDRYTAEGKASPRI